MVLAVRESLRTYASDDDCCEMQSDFRYYNHLPTGAMVALSELGAVRPDIPIAGSQELRVAWVSELRTFLKVPGQAFIDD